MLSLELNQSLVVITKKLIAKNILAFYLYPDDNNDSGELKGSFKLVTDNSDVSEAL